MPTRTWHREGAPRRGSAEDRGLAAHGTRAGRYGQELRSRHDADLPASGISCAIRPMNCSYLDQALAARQALCAGEGRPFTQADLGHAIMDGAVERVRPKMMTVT